MTATVEDVENTITVHHYGWFWGSQYDYYTTEYEYHAVQKNYINIRFDVGNHWYFNNSTKWRIGLNVNWFKAGIFIPTTSGSRIGSFSALNIGPSVVVPINVKQAITLDVIGGGHLAMNSITGKTGTLWPGYTISTMLSYKRRSFSIGIEYQFIHRSPRGIDWSNLHSFGLTTNVFF